MSIDLNAFLDETFYGIDVTAMLASIEDFLVFSEANLSWQREREVRRTRKEAEGTTFSGDGVRYEAAYRAQMIEAAEYRFDVLLTQRIRYAGLTALVTTIEWSALTLEARAVRALPEKPKGTNKAIHILRTLGSRATITCEREIDFFERLIQVRNCVVHGAGLLESYEHSEQLRASLAGMDGVGVSSKNFLGETIEIQGGALEVVLRTAIGWIPAFEKQCYEKGVVK